MISLTFQAALWVDFCSFRKIILPHTLKLDLHLFYISSHQHPSISLPLINLSSSPSSSVELTSFLTSSPHSFLNSFWHKSLHSVSVSPFCSSPLFSFTYFCFWKRLQSLTSCCGCQTFTLKKGRIYVNIQTADITGGRLCRKAETEWAAWRKQPRWTWEYINKVK